MARKARHDDIDVLTDFEKRELGYRNPADVIDDILAGRLDGSALSRELGVVQELVASLGRGKQARERFRALVAHVQRVSKLFDGRPVVDEYPRHAHNTMLGALASLATHHTAWIRPLEDWRPSTKNMNRQFASLVRHLLAEYPVPAFMDSVWFKRSRSQNWFIHVGRGHSIRTAERPLIPLTRRMAHELMQAPTHYTIEHAFRWAQVHALGGNPRVAEGVSATRLGSHFRDDDFWSTVVRFFVANPMLDTGQYGPIVDYIHHQKYATVDIFVRPGVVEREPPPHPGFSMRGRSPDLLLVQVNAWHRRLGREQRHGDHAWIRDPTPGSLGRHRGTGEPQEVDHPRAPERECAAGRGTRHASLRGELYGILRHRPFVGVEHAGGIARRSPARSHDRRASVGPARGRSARPIQRSAHAKGHGHVAPVDGARRARSA
jgi:hypothetical protein